MTKQDIRIQQDERMFLMGFLLTKNLLNWGNLYPERRRGNGGSGLTLEEIDDMIGKVVEEMDGRFNIQLNDHDMQTMLLGLNKISEIITRERLK